MTRKRRTVTDSPIWKCSRCIQQFVGGPRCTEHNPTPDEREAHPQLYTRDTFVRHIRDLVR